MSTGQVAETMMLRRMLAIMDGKGSRCWQTLHQIFSLAPACKHRSRGLTRC